MGVMWFKEEPILLMKSISKPLQKAIRSLDANRAIQCKSYVQLSNIGVQNISRGQSIEI